MTLLENNGDSEDTLLAASKKTPDKQTDEKYLSTKIPSESSGHSSSTSSLSSSSFAGLQQLGSLLQSQSSRDFAALLKNHSSFSGLSPQELSVLQSYLSAGGPISDSLLVNLMSQNNLNHPTKDNGEPVNKKSRKLDSSNKHSSLNSKMRNDFSGASYNTNLSKSLQNKSGFSLLPVNSTSNSSNNRTNIRSHNDLSKSPQDAKSSSALRLASLPGVSLTAVTTRTETASATTMSSGGLMPPPSASSVTLSPVPRSSSSSSTSSISAADSGDSKSSPSWRHSLDNNISLTQSNDSRPLLINPVTGQFESGGANENSANDIDSPSRERMDDGEDLDEIESSKAKLGSQSPGTGNSTSEPSLKFKLKVSSTAVNNSSNKSASPKMDTKSQSSSGEPEPKIPKLKIRLNKDKKSKVNNSVLSPDHEDNDVDNNSTSPQQNDLKPKIKIKPLSDAAGMQADGSVITSPYFPTLSNNIVNHTNLEDRKKKRKDKDRLAVWTESLAKHGQRSEDQGKDEKNKEQKSWPEVLEARLYGGGGGSNNTNSSNNSNNSSPGTSDHDGSLSFSGYDMVLAKQTEGNIPNSS